MQTTLTLRAHVEGRWPAAHATSSWTRRSMKVSQVREEERGREGERGRELEVEGQGWAESLPIIETVMMR